MSRVRDEDQARRMTSAPTSMITPFEFSHDVF